MLFAIVSVNAAEPQARFELTPFAGYTIGGEFEDAETGSALELDDAGSYGLILNIQAERNTQYEVLYSRQGTNLDSAALFVNQPTLDVDVHYLHFGGTYIGDGERVQPYLAATVGLSHFDPGPADFDSETYASFSIGAGLRILPAERLGLRLEGRLYSTFVDSDTDIFCRSGGEANICAIRATGSLVNQWEAFAGATVRF